MERTTIFLPRELKITIKAVAQRTGTSVAELIRNALTRYVAVVLTLDRQHFGVVEQEGAIQILP